MIKYMIYGQSKIKIDLKKDMTMGYDLTQS